MGSANSIFKGQQMFTIEIPPKVREAFNEYTPNGKLIIPDKFEIYCDANEKLPCHNTTGWLNCNVTTRTLGSHKKKLDDFNTQTVEMNKGGLYFHFVGTKTNSIRFTHTHKYKKDQFAHFMLTVKKNFSKKELVWTARYTKTKQGIPLEKPVKAINITEQGISMNCQLATNKQKEQAAKECENAGKMKLVGTSYFNTVVIPIDGEFSTGKCPVVTDTQKLGAKTVQVENKQMSSGKSNAIRSSGANIAVLVDLKESHKPVNTLANQLKQLELDDLVRQGVRILDPKINKHVGIKKTTEPLQKMLEDMKKQN